MKIEKLHDTETEAVSHLVADAFFDKFSEKTTLSMDRFQKLLKLMWIEEAENNGMSIYTLKSEGEIVASFAVTTVQKKMVSISFLAKSLAIARAIGFMEYISFLQVALETGRTIDDGEWYIDFIVVKKEFRNHNIGHRIMSTLDEMIDRDPNGRKLSLHVLKGNDRAIHLYEKYGFVKESVSRNGHYHFMVKRQF